MPVTPATSSSRVGSPKKTSAAVAIAARTLGTTSCGTSSSSGVLDDEGDGAGLDRSGGEVVAVDVLAGDAEERGAGSDGTGVVGEVPHLDGVGAAEDRLRCERGDEALELHVGGTLPRGFGARRRVRRDLELDER